MVNQGLNQVSMNFKLITATNVRIAYISYSYLDDMEMEMTVYLTVVPTIVG